MILADEISCTVATPNAVKVELIDCTTSLIDSAKGVELMWIAIGAIGAFGAMIITLFMARFAWKAWKTSREQLTLTRTIAIEQQRLPALTEFLEALHAVVAVDTSVVEEKKLRSLASEARFKADIWSISYDRIFTSKTLGNVISHLENEVIHTYELMAKVIEVQAGDGEDIGGFLEVVESVARTTMAEQIIRIAAMRLHRGEMTEEDAMKMFESSKEMNVKLEDTWLA